MIETLTDPQNIILFLASAATFMTIIAVALPYMQHDQLSSRLKTVAKRREELSQQQRERIQKRPVLRAAHLGAMKAILERLKLENILHSPALRSKMSQAGWRGQAPMVIFGFTRLLAPIVFTIFAAIILFGGDNFDMETNGKILSTVGAAVAGFYLPNLMVQNVIQKRQHALNRGFPDALDLLVICVEAGLSIEAAFSRVAEELADSWPIVAEEFGLTTAELAFLGDRRLALENLSQRTGTDGVRSLATALIQSERYGTPLAVSLRVLSQESRDKRLSRAEEKAGSLPAKLTIPMILFFLPVVFFVVLGPAIIQVMKQF